MKKIVSFSLVSILALLTACTDEYPTVSVYINNATNKNITLVTPSDSLVTQSGKQTFLGYAFVENRQITGWSDFQLRDLEKVEMIKINNTHYNVKEDEKGFLKNSESYDYLIRNDGKTDHPTYELTLTPELIRSLVLE